MDVINASTLYRIELDVFISELQHLYPLYSHFPMGLRQYMHFCKMDNDRLNKRKFRWAETQTNLNWNPTVQRKLVPLNLVHLANHNFIIGTKKRVKLVHEAQISIHKTEGNNEIM